MSLVASERSDRYCPVSEKHSVSPETVRGVATAKLQLYEEALASLLDQQPPEQLAGLYGIPSYDASFIRDMLGLRGGGVREFSDISKTSADYTAIRNTALKLGFLHEELGDELEHSGRKLDIALPRDVRPIGDVSAVIIPGGVVPLTVFVSSAPLQRHKRARSTPQKLFSPPATAQQLKRNAGEPKHRVLYNLLTAYGFTINPHEWWHFDYGNQLWAFVQNYQLGEKAVRALFGAAG